MPGALPALFLPYALVCCGCYHREAAAVSGKHRPLGRLQSACCLVYMLGCTASWWCGSLLQEDNRVTTFVAGRVQLHMSIVPVRGGVGHAIQAGWSNCCPVLSSAFQQLSCMCWQHSPATGPVLTQHFIVTTHLHIISRLVRSLVNGTLSLRAVLHVMRHKHVALCGRWLCVLWFIPPCEAGSC